MTWRWPSTPTTRSSCSPRSSWAGGSPGGRSGEASPRAGRTDRRRQRLDVVRAVVPLPVDEERRRAGDAARGRRTRRPAATRPAGRAASGRRGTAPRPGRAPRRTAIRSLGWSLSWCASSRSCISQNAPWAAAASAASAAICACGCTSVSGRCRQTYRRSSSPADRGRRARPARSTGTRSRRTRPRSPTRLRAADVVALRVDRGIRSISCSASPSSSARPPRLGQRGGTRNTGQVSSDATTAGGEHAELRLGQLAARRTRGCDQQRHGEADAGDGPAADHAGPADGRPDPATAQPGQQPGHADHRDRLADDVAEQDAERDRRGDAPGPRKSPSIVMPALARPNSGTIT